MRKTSVFRIVGHYNIAIDFLLRQFLYNQKQNFPASKKAAKVAKISKKGLIMIVEFSVENYRSFSRKQSLNFAADPETCPKSLNSERTIETKNTKVPQLVRSILLYGPNASGKSNLIQGLSTMQLLSLDFLDTEKNLKKCYTPFLLNDEGSKKSTSFEICVVIDGVYYDYNFSYNHEKICEESLSVKLPGKKMNMIFKREVENCFNTTKIFSTAFDHNCDYLKKMRNWLSNNLVVMHGYSVLDFFSIGNKLANPIYAKKMLKFLQQTGSQIKDIRELLDIEKSNGQLEIIELAYKNNNKELVWFDYFMESPGTQKLLIFADIFFDVFENGKFLVIDEIEKHLHPNIVDYILFLFADNDTNPHGAQLLATAYNTHFLDARGIEQDQIWFAKKDKNQSTLLYPLTDFHVRENFDLERDYLAGRYGALPNVDF